MKYLLKFYLLILSTLLGMPAFAQLEPIQIQLTVPYRQHVARLSELQEMVNRNEVQLTMLNTSTQTLKFQLEVSFSSPGFSVLTNPNAVPSWFTLSPGESYTLTRNNIEGLFFEDSFITGDGKSLEEYFGGNFLDSSVPEGDYELCIRARPEVLNQQLTNLLSNVDCASVPMRGYTPPLIASVNDAFCGGNVQRLATENGILRVNWSAPIVNENGVASTNFTYKLSIVELLPEFGGDPNQIVEALKTGIEPRQYTVNKTDIPGSGSINESVSLTAGNVDFIEPLKPGSQYVVFVKADNGSGQPLPNDGYSVVCVFSYGDGEVVTPITIAESDANLPWNCENGHCNEIEVPTGGTVVQSLPAGSEVYIGCFKVKVTETTGSANGFNGKGLVKIPLFSALFKVSFSELVVHQFTSNTGNKLAAISGSAKGLKDNEVNDIVGELYDKFDATRDAGDAYVESLDPAIGDFIKSKTENKINAVDAAFKTIRNIDRTIRQIGDDNFESGLPIGYSAEMSGEPLRVGIFGMKFTPQMATMQIIVQTPTIAPIGQALYFGASNACFSQKELSLTQATFYLGGDLTFDLPKGHKLTLKGSGHDRSEGQSTYLTLNEGNLKELKLTGEIELDNSIFVPKPPATGKVKITFVSNAINNFDDLILSSTVEIPVALASMKSFGFMLKGLSLDLSTTRNPTDWSIDTELRNEMYPGSEFIETWTGIHIKEAGIILPSDFNLGNVARSPSLTVKNMVIGFDGSGVSFNAGLGNIMTLNDGGSLGGLGFAIDSLNMKMVSNRIDAFFLKGKLRFGLFDAGTYDGAFPYKIDLLDLINRAGNSGNAGSGDGELALALDITLNENIDLTISKLHTTFTLGANSRVEYNSRGLDGVADRKLRFKLNGGMSIVADDVNLPGMHFQNFIFEGHDLKLDQFTVGFASPQKMVGGIATTDGSTKAGGFPISIEGFRPILGAGTNGGMVKFGFGFDIILNLKEGAGFGLTTAIDITTELDQSFKPTLDIDVAFKKISIEADVSVSHVSGFLEFVKDDPGVSKWGKGFRGCISIEFKKPAPIKGVIQGMFGSMNPEGQEQAFRYFYLEGLIKGLPGILIPSTPIAIDGFAGGFWYNMAEEGNPPSFAARLNSPPGGDDCTPPPLIPAQGKMGIAFGIMFKEAASDGFSFNGMLAFRADLTTDLAPETFSVMGAATFLKLPEAGKVPASAGEITGDMRIAADIELEYDFTENVFSGEFNVYINIMGVLRGAAANDRAGRMVMYFGRNDWYVYLGNPWGHTGDPGRLLTGSEEDKYATLKFEIGDFRIETGAYFCIGSYGISGLPPLPSDERLIGMPDGLRSTLERGRPQADPRASEGGVAFGAYICLDLKDSFGPVDASFAAGFGFDVALVKYNRSVKCDGDQIGINGAYARGQVYGYVNGKLTAEFLGDTYKIFDLEAQFFGDFGGPNPTWVDGEVSISNQSIINSAGRLGLGWAADGLLDEDESTSIAVSVGTKCTPSAASGFDDKYGSVSPITYITPESTIEPFGSVTVNFNKAIGSTWTLTKDNLAANRAAIAVNNRFSYTQDNIEVPPAYISYIRRWFIKEVRVKRGSTELVGAIGKFTKSQDGKEMVFLLYDALYNTTQLKPNDNITFRIVLGIEQHTGDNDWKVLRKYNDNSDATDIREIVLKVGEINYELANSDVASSYPVNGQKYFLKGQTLNSFVKLTRHFPELISEKSMLTAKVYADNAVINTSAASYKSVGGNAGFITYSLPNNLPNDADIRVEFYRLPSSLIPNMIQTPVLPIQIGVIGATFNPNAASQNTSEVSMGLRIYSLNFHTSRYNSFSEKMASLRSSPFAHEGDDSYVIETTVSTDEGWDDFEVYPNQPHSAESISDRYRADRRGADFRNCLQVTTKLNTAWHASLIPIYDDMIRNIDATSWEEYAFLGNRTNYIPYQKAPVLLASLNTTNLWTNNISEKIDKINGQIGFAPMVPPRRQMAEAAKRQAREIESSFGDLIRNSPSLVVETSLGNSIPNVTKNTMTITTLPRSGAGIVLHHRYNNIVRRGDLPPTAGDYEFIFTYRAPAINANGDIVYANAVNVPVNLQLHYNGFTEGVATQQKKAQSDIITVKSFR